MAEQQSKQRMLSLMVASFALGIVLCTWAFFISKRELLLGIKNSNNEKVWQPPIARRDSERFVQVGIPPADWDPLLPRQSQESRNPLLDPPQLVPDPYGWLRDDKRSDPEILAHLHAENNYTQSRLQHLQVIQDQLYDELLQYMEETSHSFPLLDRSFFYYYRTVQGQPYPLHCRAPIPDNRDGESFNSGLYLQKYLSTWDGHKDTPILPNEVVYMDENLLAKNHEFFATGSIAISPSQHRLAYTVDTTGNELYQLRVVDMITGAVLFVSDPDKDGYLTEEVLWGLDDDTLFYSKPDEIERPYQVCRRHLLQGTEELLYEEDDLTYGVDFGFTMDDKYLLIETGSSDSSEVYYMDLAVRDSTLNLVSKRRQNVLYGVEHYNGYWWLLSNVNDPDGDMELFTVPVGQERDDLWTQVMDPSAGTPLLDGVAKEDLTVFQNHIVIEGRSEGILGLWILEMGDNDASRVSKVNRVAFTVESAHTTRMSTNLEYNTTTILIEYVSLVTPQQHIQVDLYHPNLADGRLVVYETPVPGYDKTRYGCQRITVQARDQKTMIPVSLLYRLSTWNVLQEEKAIVPIHLYAYGAYGMSMDDEFSSAHLPLLDRGMIFAVAHVRGGGEMGRNWYIDGKLLNKHNTFDDFVDVARYFTQQQWTTPELLSCEGRSAGGLTMGASLNQAPDLFRAALLGVPFVDLVVTMMDASIPLTTGEWSEWGNPNEPEYFDTMMSYSPMNNVKAAIYPSMLLLAGLFDPRVAYWEPAKLAATLRYETIPHPDRPVCLKTDLTSGHFSASDRYKHVRERSFECAFILDQLGLI